MVANLALGKASEQALLGESIALCLDVMFPGSADGGGMPPLFHLASSTVKFASLKKKAKAAKVVEENQPGP